MRYVEIICMGGLLAVSSASAQTPRVQKVATPVGAGSYIGVMMQEVDSQRAKELKLTEEAGVEITRVTPDSPADKAGLKTGDVVMRYNGQRIEGMEQFSRMVRETPAGRDTKLEIVRNGVNQSVMVKVAARPAARGFALGDGTGIQITPMAPGERFDIHIPDIPRSFMSWRSSALGVEAEALDGQLAEYFGVKDGVLVRSVTKGSAGDKAGLKAGDVITRIDNNKVATPGDISSRIRLLQGKSVGVVLMRDHHEMTLSVTVDDEDRSEWFFQGNSGEPPRRMVNPIRQ
jgi:serine protease Do